MLLATFGAFLLLQQPFKDSKFWKLPICAAVVFCTLLKELLDLATSLMLQDESWLRVGFAKAMVWLFTITVLSLPVIMLVSFFYYNYMSSACHFDGNYIVRHHGLQPGNSFGKAERSTLPNAVCACAVGTAADAGHATWCDTQENENGADGHEMLTIVPQERRAKKAEDSRAQANTDKSDVAAEEEGQLDDEAHVAHGMPQNT